MSTDHPFPSPVPLADSPVGLLAWMLEKSWAWSDHGDDIWDTFDLDLLLTNALLHWLPARPLTAASIYHQSKHAAEDVMPGRIEVPTGYMRSPLDMLRSTRMATGK